MTKTPLMQAIYRFEGAVRNATGGPVPDPAYTAVVQGITDFVAAWITTYGPYDDDGEMVREWRAEMGGDPS